MNVVEAMAAAIKGEDGVFNGAPLSKAGDPSTRAGEVARRDGFLLGYMVAALWSSRAEEHPDNPTENDDRCFDDVGFSVDDFDPNTALQMAVDCYRFRWDNADDLDEFCREADRDMERAGHDFWLTRNGHGAGFWDRGAGDVGERLSEAARAYGEVDLFTQFDADGEPARVEDATPPAFHSLDEAVALVREGASPRP